jgi:hypothetical protein
MYEELDPLFWECSSPLSFTLEIIKNLKNDYLMHSNEILYWI